MSAGALFTRHQFHVSQIFSECGGASVQDATRGDQVSPVRDDWARVLGFAR